MQTTPQSHDNTGQLSTNQGRPLERLVEYEISFHYFLILYITEDRQHQNQTLRNVEMHTSRK